MDNATIVKYLIRFNKTSKRQKVKKENFSILEFGDYENFEKNNYTLKQLKEMCKYHKLKQSGNKEILELTLYNYLRLSYNALKIQKLMRGYLIRKYVSLKGPGLYDRKKCTNDTDFYSLEPLEDIPQNQFYSFADKAGFIYGFDLVSIFNIYVMEQRKKIVNPYNREELPKEQIDNMIDLIRLTHILKFPVQIELEKIAMTEEQQLNQYALSLFQTINDMGNYSDHEWFMTLHVNSLKVFVNQLFDIWYYRAQLTSDKRMEIVHPHGNPFYAVNRLTFQRSMNKNYLIHKGLTIIEQFITKGIDEENKKLGAMYVLSALTLVSQQAAETLPWLYESVV